MPPHYRRILFSDDCDPWYGCPTPPAPPFFTPSPFPSPSSPPPIISPPPPPSPSFSFYFPSPPDLAPSPSPVHDGGGGWSDQGGGTYGYGAVDDHRRRFVTYVLCAAAALAFLSLILLGASIAVRRRQLRRRRQALLAQPPAAATNVGNDDPEGGGSGGVVHHVWYIRTVGLDEAAIDSIAVTRYRAGSGLLGAADCSVCLGEFNDGELVRLLPKCGHAFHVPCIDTWLRAHVNCPLCRSDVIDPAATTAGAGIESDSNPSADPDVNANAAAEQAAAASDSTLEHEDDEEDQEAPRVEEDQHEQQQPNSPEPEPLPQLPGPLPRNVRRAASMNAAMVSTAADVAALDRLPDAAPEGEERNGREKHQSGATGHPSTERPAPGGLPRSFFARHCRARSSVLPL
ncbi:uncharacterized protein [Aegilops tauschii subsp. strangulata]|nr:RING-H2 finger protein ATL52 [Aegilops tauschii subsp. strangulata]